MITTKSTTRKKRNIFGALKHIRYVELVPDPFNTGYDEKKRRELEAKKRKQA